MKKMLLIATSFFLVWFQLHAQKEKKTHFGIKGGFNHTVINGFETNGKKTGYVGSTIYGSLFSENKVGASTYVCAEILFSWVNDWHFIEVPVHIRQMVSKKFGISIGPKLDITADRFDQQKESRSRLFGVSAEVGTQYNFNRRLFAEARYSVGLTRQFKDEGFDINNGKRNNFRLGIGFRF